MLSDADKRLLLATAREYLRPTNRTILTIVPQPEEAPAAAGAGAEEEAS